MLGTSSAVLCSIKHSTAELVVFFSFSSLYRHSTNNMCLQWFLNCNNASRQYILNVENCCSPVLLAIFAKVRSMHLLITSKAECVNWAPEPYKNTRPSLPTPNSCCCSTSDSLLGLMVEFINFTLNITSTPRLIPHMINGAEVKTAGRFTFWR